MANIFDYFLWRGDLPLKYNGFNEIDGVILARFSYLPFEKIESLKKIYSIYDISLALLNEDIKEYFIQKEDEKFIETIKECERFKNMEVFGFVNEIDLESQTQFSAITIKINEDTIFISFRGTDNTLVGWKEDFNMSFTYPVPAQIRAVRYINEITKYNNYKIILGGHSKGGNLAIYGGAFCNRNVQRRINKIYNFDGPGFLENFLESDEYKRICGRINTFVPQSSVVGMIFERKEKYKIVESDGIGILQHDIYLWRVERDRFVCLEDVDNSSKFFDYTIKKWIADLDYEQRQKFIDAIYTIMIETNSTTLKELSDN
ncbi:MAG: DUF2974 domain-containing protein [Lachnospirales bacterium]